MLLVQLQNHNHHHHHHLVDLLLLKDLQLLHLWDHLVEVLDFLMRSVVAPMDLEVPLSEESVLFSLMAVHMDSSLVHCLVQMPLFLESFLLSHQKFNPTMDQKHIPCPMECQKPVFHSFVELVDP